MRQHRRQWRLALLAALAVQLLGTLAAVEVTASTGAALDVGAISLDKILRPGESYELPVIGVRNPGSEPATYRMGLGGIGGDDYADPGADWVEFSPRQFDLTPGERQVVNIRLVIPDAAAEDRYEGLLRAEVADNGTGVAIGVAAAARLSFEVGASNGESPLPRAIGSVIETFMPWCLLGSAIFVGTVMITYVSRRYRFRIESRR